MIHALTALLTALLTIFSGPPKPGAVPPPLSGLEPPFAVNIQEEVGPTGSSGATGTSGATGASGASGPSAALGPTGAAHPYPTKVPAINTSSGKPMPANIPIVAIEHSPSLDYATGAVGAAPELHQNNGKGPKNK